MSSNFLDRSGHFVGFDLHLYYTPPGLPVPNIHAVAQLHLLGRPWRVVTTVSTNGHNVLQSNWSMVIVPHIPVPLPQNPVAEGVNLATIIATGASAPQLSAHSVTGKKEALLTSIVSAFGANSDCGILLVPTNVDVNLNTVKTTPSMGDYVGAAVGMLLNGIYNAWTGGPDFGKHANKISIAIAVLQNVLDIPQVPVADPIAWVINKVTSIVQQKVDS